MKSDDAPTTWLRVEPLPSTASQPVETALLIDAPRREPARMRQWFGIILGIAVLFGVVGGGAYWALYRTSDAPLAEVAPAAKPAELTAPPKTSEPVATASATTPAAPEAADAATSNLVFGSGPILGQAPPPQAEESAPAARPPARTAQAPPPAAPAAPSRKVHVQRAPPSAAAAAPAPPTGSAAGIRF